MECHCSRRWFSFTTGFPGKEKTEEGGRGAWLSEVPWLMVGLVVGHQSIRTRVLVISRLVLLTPGLLVPELQKHGGGIIIIIF